ncbi:hypothetical protein [uncultured Jatrophihabitans sp.]
MPDGLHLDHRRLGRNVSGAVACRAVEPGHRDAAGIASHLDPRQ